MCGSKSDDTFATTLKYIKELSGILELAVT